MRCALCKAHLREGRVNHIVDYGERIIIIKNVPANTCNQCGEYYIDTEIALKLESIIDEIIKSKVEISIINYDEMVA